MRNPPTKLPKYLREALSRYATERTVDSGFHYTARAKVQAVEDGDTWFGRHKPDPELIVATDSDRRDDEKDQDGQYYRLSKADTHETDATAKKKRKMAKEEKQFVESWVATGRKNYSGDWPFKIVYKSEATFGTYGRRLTDLIRLSDGQSLVQSLFAQFPDRDIKYDPATEARDA